MKENKKLYYAGGAFLVILLVALDQITKHLAVLHLKNQENFILIKGIMELEYLENHGAAFGILQNQQTLFLILFFVFLVAVGYAYVRMPKKKRYAALHLIALFIIAGGIGNQIDRILYGYVIDFFYFSLIDFPIFNVADIYVTVSIFLLILFILFYYKDEDFELIFHKNRNG